jgi:hypothetical protein
MPSERSTTAHRTHSILAIGVALALSLLSAGTALADKPPGTWAGQPDDDTYIPPRTPEQAAFEQVKLALVDAIGEFAATGAFVASPDSEIVSPDMICATCDPGSPPPSMVLDTRARDQTTAWYCGPASGQVVINYTRGYFYNSLDGERTDHNWRTQTTIAGWMHTTQSSGTSGGNLADALNRSDAVVKPVPAWSYLYATNADGQAMHNKVVADVYGYSMPLDIAIKPHETAKNYYLPNWPNEAAGVKHWIAIRGYNGFWDGTNTPRIYYSDSSGNGGNAPGNYSTGSLTMWKVNKYNASTIVW